MTYYLVGIDEAKGTVADDITENKPYYELGWEIISTHFDVKHMKKAGIVNAERDTIVTCAGREFLYSAEFSHVIRYEDFQSRLQSHPDKVVSLMDRYLGGVLPRDYFASKHSPLARYRYFEEDRDIITHFDLSGATREPPETPYCCFVIRKRKHGAYRNFNDDMASVIIAKLTKRYDNVFIVGRDIEQFHNLPRVHHVNLQTFAALIQHDQCHLIVGSLTGPMHIAALVSKARTCLIVNHDGYDLKMENHPVLMGHCITYSNSRMFFVHPLQLPEILENFRL